MENLKWRRIRKNFSEKYLALFLAALMMIGIYLAVEKKIEISYAGETYAVFTLADTIEELLADENIEIGEHDYVSRDLTDLLRDGDRVEIVIAFPIRIQVDGEQKIVYALPGTTAEILQKEKITLGDLDQTKPCPTEIIKKAGEIIVTRMEKINVVEEVNIAYKTKRTEDHTLERGIRKILQKGVKGKKNVEYEEIWQNGIMVEKNKIGETVVKEPIEEIMAYGTITVASRNGNNFHFSQVLEMEATAYTHTGNQTYTGTWPKVGTIAVDPKIIPLKSRLYVEGYGYGIAEDTGGAIRGNIVDVFMDTRWEALKWGRKQVKVYIIE